MHLCELLPILARIVFETRRLALHDTCRAIEKQLVLAERELTITKPLQKSGAASEIEVLRLKQRVLALSAKVAQYQSKYTVAAKEDLSKVMTELEALRKTWDGRVGKLKWTTMAAPMRGIVKDIATESIGGVAQPGGILLEIVPTEDHLLIEAQISRRDIAFIRPGQDAVVKIDRL